MPDYPVRPTRRWVRVAVVSAIVAGGWLTALVVTVALLTFDFRSPPVDEAFANTDPDLSLLRMSPMDVPHSLQTTADSLPPDAQVVGVSAGGGHRAYALSAFASPNLHVVNDLIGDTPVTVTHCPRDGCTKVLTGPNGGRLRIAVGGWSARAGAAGMLLRVAGEQPDNPLYLQRTGQSVVEGLPLPLASMDFELTTWGEWRQAHPDTDAYTGGAIISY